MPTNRAVFLDRDGVINKEVENLRNVQQLRILPGVAQAIRTLNQAGFFVIVITNQPVVARGWITELQLQKIHQVLISRLLKRGARIDAIYYCPHHPQGNLKKYRKKCSCRKPNIGLIKKAAKRFSLALQKSFLVGDMTGDIRAGKNAKLKTILVRTGFQGKDGKYEVKPNWTAQNLLSAARIIKTYGE